MELPPTHQELLGATGQPPGIGGVVFCLLRPPSSTSGGQRLNSMPAGGEKGESRLFLGLAASVEGMGG